MIRISLMLLSFTFALGCEGLKTETVNNRTGGTNKSADSKSQGPVASQPLAILKTARELPTCNAERKGETYYIVVENQFRFCDAKKKWSVISLNGKDGINGVSPLVNNTEEGSGPNCGHGGTKWQAGYDIDSDRKLSASEITVTTYICNGNPTPSIPAAVLTSLVITPTNESAPVGFSPQFTAIATWNNGMKLDITNSTLLVWSSSDNEIVSMSNDSGSRGIGYLMDTGSVTITATYDKGVAGTTQFTVNPPEIINVDVDDYLDLTLNFEGSNSGLANATATYSNWDTVDISKDATTVFRSSDTNIATVSNLDADRGLVRAVGFGCAQIDVTSPTPWQAPEHKISWLYAGLIKSEKDPNYAGGVSVRRMSLTPVATLSYKGQTYRENSDEIRIADKDPIEIQLTAQYENGTSAPISNENFSFETERHSPTLILNVIKISSGGKVSWENIGRGRILVNYNDLPEVNPSCHNKPINPTHNFRSEFALEFIENIVPPGMPPSDPKPR